MTAASRVMEFGDSGIRGIPQVGDRKASVRHSGLRGSARTRPTRAKPSSARARPNSDAFADEQIFVLEAVEDGLEI